MRALTALVALCVASACGGLTIEDELYPPEYRLGGLRVLAVKAEPPGPAEGAETSLSALVFEPHDVPARLRWSWCPLPTSGGACAVPAEAFAADIGATPPAYDLGESEQAALRNVVSRAAAASLCARGVPTTTGRRAVTCTYGFPIEIGLTVAATGDEVRARATLWLPTKEGAANGNPPGFAIAFTGEGLRQHASADAPAVVTRDEEVLVEASVPETAAETMPDPAAPGGTRKERLFLSWFVESGDLVHRRTSFIDGEVTWTALRTNKWTPPTVGKDPQTRRRVFVVARDERGGASFSSAVVDYGAAR